MVKFKDVSTLADLQRQAGFTFRDEALLRRALTHRSYANEHPEEAEDNERLEFLGDAVLDFLVGATLYHRFPEMAEGDLTRLRAALVRTEQLAAFAEKVGVSEAIRLGKGETVGGGRKRLSVMCATFEAIVGALYLDAGMEAVRAFAEPLFLPAAAAIVNEQAAMDAKSQFQEWAQSELNQTPHYKTVSAEGPDHEKFFTVEVRVGGEVYGTGTGPSKQTAAQAAAMDALRRIGAV